MRLHLDVAIPCGNGSTRFTQLVDDRIQVVGAAIEQLHLTTGGGYRTQKCAGLNAVSHHLVRAAMQAFYPLNANPPRSVALNFCAHFDKHFSQVANLGLLSGVFQNGFALGQRGGHQKVFRARNRHHVSSDTATHQARAASGQLGNHVAVLHHNLGAHRLQPLDVLIDRARANGTATRQRHRRLAETR